MNTSTLAKIRFLLRKRSVRLTLIVVTVLFFFWNIEQIRREQDRASRYRNSLNGFLKNEAKLKEFIVETGKRRLNPRDAADVPDKYLVVKCDKEYENLVDCNDWSLLLKSIYSGFWVAKVINRKYGINIRAPCDLERFYKPNLIEWNNLPASDPSKVSTRLIYEVGSIAVPRLKPAPFDFNEILAFDDAKAKMVMFLTNKNFADKMFKNTTSEVKQAIDELVKRENINMTIQDGFPVLFQELFLMTDAFKEKYNNMVSKLRARRGSKVICVELNLNLEDKARQVQKTVESRDIDLELMKQFWAFTRQHLVGNLSNFVEDNPGYTLFLKTDQVRVVHETMHEFVNQTDVVNNWGIEMNGESQAEAEVDEDSCKSFERTLLDFHALAHCDKAVIMGPTDLSNLGLYRMSKAKKDQLVLFRYSNSGLFEQLCHLDNLTTQ